MKGDKASELLYYGGESAYMTDDTGEIFDMLENYVRGRVHYCDAFDDVEVMVVTDYGVYVGFDENNMIDAQEFYDEMGC